MLTEDEKWTSSEMTQQESQLFEIGQKSGNLKIYL